MSSTFDLDSLENAVITESNDTKFVPVPEGEYPAFVKEKVMKQTPSGRSICELVWSIDSDVAREATGLAEPTVRQALWLDITPHGTLDMGRGKNVQLGKVRDALGLNAPGKPFSFGMLIGQAAVVSVKHRITDDGTPFGDVKSIRKA
jgi:hypothetical protein